ncbi:homoserine O-acetyltransferase MetX [Heliorestis convoluta]|uniref:Homoserine O-acetyltransferase n=1 Tax=Heliorestis convoluta TaxID=356322 RepID=A0A5Q2MZ07_9FIRM|nr:homoserine O-acetyltransferase [Heliorestis convoluta]QGG46673.1 homoserine O-acetyltransferase [Heliorestis convoluta]
MYQGASRFSVASSARELITKTEHFTFAISPEEMVLESGHRLGPITLAYETYGTLNEGRSNAILVAHALTGDQHAAGKYDKSDKAAGWWDDMIGPGKTIDTNRFFVICSNVLGGCRGTTGPSSINPATEMPYGMNFPVFTIRDMVRAQKALVQHLGVERLLCVIGGSMGGMQVLEWAVTYPDQIDGILPIATAGRMTAMGIAFNEVMRQSIMLDPTWNQGNYYPEVGPAQGLSIARMLGMITYRSDELFNLRFGRRMVHTHPDEYFRFDSRFEIESYLHYQGDKLVKRFDANSYLYLCKAMDLHDIGRRRGGLAKALGRIKAKTLFVGIDSDWLYPPSYMIEMAHLMEKKRKDVEYKELKSPHGHDAFLIEFDQMSPIIRDFIFELAESRGL